MNENDTIGEKVPMMSTIAAVTARNIRPTRDSLGRSVKKRCSAAQ